MIEPITTAYDVVSYAIDVLSEAEADSFAALTDEIVAHFGIPDGQLSDISLPDLMRYAMMYLSGSEETAYLGAVQSIVAIGALSEPTVANLLHAAHDALPDPEYSVIFTRCTNRVLDHFRFRGRMRLAISASTLALLAESIADQLDPSYQDWITNIVEELAPGALTEHLP